MLSKAKRENWRHNVCLIHYRYDPSTGKWKAVPDMATPRRNAAATVVHNFLYIVGGDDGIMNLSSIEVFDPFYETWKYAKGRLTQGRSYAGVAVVDKPSESIAP